MLKLSHLFQQKAYTECARMPRFKHKKNSIPFIRFLRGTSLLLPQFASAKCACCVRFGRSRRAFHRHTVKASFPPFSSTNKRLLPTPPPCLVPNVTHPFMISHTTNVEELGLCSITQVNSLRGRRNRIPPNIRGVCSGRVCVHVCVCACGRYVVRRVGMCAKGVSSRLRKGDAFPMFCFRCWCNTNKKQHSFT